MFQYIQNMFTGASLSELESTKLRSYLELFNTKELKEKFSVSGRSKADVVNAIIATTLTAAVSMFQIYNNQKYAEAALMAMKVKELQEIFGIKARKKADIVLRILSDANNRTLIQRILDKTTKSQPGTNVCDRLSVPIHRNRSNSNPTGGSVVCTTDSPVGLKPINGRKPKCLPTTAITSSTSMRGSSSSTRDIDPLKAAVTAIRKFQNTPRPSRRGVPTSVREKVWRKCHTFKVDGEYRCSMDGQCFCCQTAITFINHQSGHIISDRHGGEISLANLRPVCGSCNKNMGSANMLEYMFRMGWTDSIESTTLIHLDFYNRLERSVLHKASLNAGGKPDEKLQNLLNYKKVPLDFRMKLVTALLLGC